jgi:hypothetical protein
VLRSPRGTKIDNRTPRPSLRGLRIRCRGVSVPNDQPTLLDGDRITSRDAAGAPDAGSRRAANAAEHMDFVPPVARVLGGRLASWGSVDGTGSTESAPDVVRGELGRETGRQGQELRGACVCTNQRQEPSAACPSHHGCADLHSARRAQHRASVAEGGLDLRSASRVNDPSIQGLGCRILPQNGVSAFLPALDEPSQSRRPPEHRCAIAPLRHCATAPLRFTDLIPARTPRAARSRGCLSASHLARGWQASRSSEAPKPSGVGKAKPGLSEAGRDLSGMPRASTIPTAAWASQTPRPAQR